MEELNVKELFQFFISKTWLFLIVIVLTVIVGVGYAVLTDEPMYHSNTDMIIVGTTGAKDFNKDGIIVVIQNSVNLDSTKFVNTYNGIIKSRTLLTNVINTLNLDYTADELSGKINVSTVLNTDIIRINVKSLDAKEAADIANELAESFSETIKEVYNVEKITIVDKAEASSELVKVNIIKQVIICLAVGVVLSCVIMFIMFFYKKDEKGIKF